jgi:hypothetical protein
LLLRTGTATLYFCAVQQDSKSTNFPTASSCYATVVNQPNIFSSRWKGLFADGWPNGEAWRSNISAFHRYTDYLTENVCTNTRTFKWRGNTIRGPSSLNSVADRIAFWWTNCFTDCIAFRRPIWGTDSAKDLTTNS